MEKFADIYLALPLETSEMQVEYKGMQLVFPLKTFEKFVGIPLVSITVLEASGMPATFLQLASGKSTGIFMKASGEPPIFSLASWWNIVNIFFLFLHKNVC